MSIKKTVTAEAIEQSVLDLEGVRVILRVGSKKKVAVAGYGDVFKNRCAKTNNLSTLRKRIAQVIGSDIEVDIVDGSGASVNGNTKIGNLRELYLSA
ncbi:hypothetical protein ACSA002_1190 [Salmonella phage vB_SalM_SA002]|nr:hypothetical protein ACSA002_1190 [Salmonella phage vB_SalM_SA002]